MVGIRVKVIEVGLQHREHIFKKWDCKNSNYFLVNSWFKVMVKNELRDRDGIKIQVFKIDGKLAFELVKLSISTKSSFFKKSSTKDSDVDGRVLFLSIVVPKEDISMFYVLDFRIVFFLCSLILLLIFNYQPIEIYARTLVIHDVTGEIFLNSIYF